MFPALDLCLGTGGIAFALGRATVDFVMNTLSRFVFGHSLGTFFCSEIAAVTIDDLLLASQKIGCHTDVMLVGSCYFQRVHKPALVVNAHMCLVAKVSCVTLPGGVGIRIPFFVPVLGRGW